MILFTVASFILVQFSACELADLEIECKLTNARVGRCRTLGHCPSARNLMNNGIQPVLCHDGQVCCEEHVVVPVKPLKPSFPVIGDRLNRVGSNILISSSCFSGNTNTERSNGYLYETFSTTTTEDTDAIIDEKDTQINFMTKIGWRNFNGDVSYRCGGTLVSPNFILSAAHCMNYKGRKPDVVQIGTNLIDDEYSSSEAIFERIPISRVHVHPQYSEETMYDDLALIELAVKSRYLPACVWAANIDQVSTSNLFAIGHDLQNNGKLQSMQTQFFSNSDCNDLYAASRKLPYGISEKQMCAVNSNITDTNACKGYIGGPFFTQSPLGEFLMIGLTNFGARCTSNNPNIYTKLSAYREWMQNIIY